MYFNYNALGQLTEEYDYKDNIKPMPTIELSRVHLSISKQMRRSMNRIEAILLPAMSTLPAAAQQSIEHSYIKTSTFTSMDGTNVEAEEEFLKYATIYKYDGRHRCIYKMLPACEPIYYIYDKAGTLIFTQDGNQRERGEWTFTIPDRLGRDAVKGTCRNTLDYLRESLKDKIVWADFKNTEEFSTRLGYKVEGISLLTAHYLGVKFYDSYSYIGSMGIPSSLRYQTPNAGYATWHKDSKGLLTGEASISIPYGAKFTAYYYDDKGQMEELVNSI